MNSPPPMGCDQRARRRVGSLALLAALAGCAATGGEPHTAAGGEPPAAPPATSSAAGPQVAAHGPMASADLGPAAGPGARAPELTAPPAEERRAPSPATGASFRSLSSTEPAGEGGIPVHGFLRSVVRGRTTGSENDVDMYNIVAVDVGDPARHPVTGHFMGRLAVDFGGNDPNDLFFSLIDTFGDVDATLYYAYVDAEQIDSVDLLRLGRQQIWDTPAFIVFDGLRVDAGNPEGIEFGAYGGLRAQYYDTSSNDDVVAGLYGQARPWEGGRLRLDYMYLEDEFRLGQGQNDLFGLELWQFVGEGLTLEGDYTRLENEDRDVRLRAHYLDADSDLSIQATYYTLLQTQSDQALEINPYFSSLLEYYPFQQVGLLASKGFNDVVNLNLGIDTRRLNDSDDVGEFNHDFDRYYASAVFLDLLVEGLDLTVLGDVWDDDQQDVQTWGLDLTQQIKENWVGSLGSYYSLYKYDLFQTTERDNVRTYYGSLLWESSESLDFDARYEYEDTPFETYHTLRLGVRWLF